MRIAIRILYPLFVFAVLDIHCPPVGLPVSQSPIRTHLTNIDTAANQSRAVKFSAFGGDTSA